MLQWTFVVLALLLAIGNTFGDMRSNARAAADSPRERETEAHLRKPKQHGNLSCPLRKTKRKGQLRQALLDKVVDEMAIHDLTRIRSIPRRVCNATLTPLTCETLIRMNATYAVTGGQIWFIGDSQMGLIFSYMRMYLEQPVAAACLCNLSGLILEKGCSVEDHKIYKGNIGYIPRKNGRPGLVRSYEYFAADTLEMHGHFDSNFDARCSMGALRHSYPSVIFYNQNLHYLHQWQSPMKPQLLSPHINLDFLRGGSQRLKEYMRQVANRSTACTRARGLPAPRVIFKTGNPLCRVPFQLDPSDPEVMETSKINGLDLHSFATMTWSDGGIEVLNQAMRVEVQRLQQELGGDRILLLDSFKLYHASCWRHKSVAAGHWVPELPLEFMAFIQAVFLP